MECCSSATFFRRRVNLNIFTVRLLLRYDLKRVFVTRFTLLPLKSCGGIEENDGEHSGYSV